MNKFKTYLKSKLLKSNPGQSFAEYALILGLVAAGAILSLAVIGVDTRELFMRINDAFGIAADDLPPGTIEVTVWDARGNTVGDVWVYAFDDNGSWTGSYKRTDANGIALFEDMKDGGYQFMAYQSQYYWSTMISFPRENHATIEMKSNNFTVKVIDGKGKGVSGVVVYAYTANEQYWLGIYDSTGSDGTVTLNLPNGDYKFRAYYRSQWYWSPAVNSPDQNSTVIDMKEERMTVTVVDAAGKGVKASNLYVYAYTEGGSYTGIYGTTNGNGRVQLTVPAGDYKFRVYYRAYDYWSESVNSPDKDEVVIETGERPFTVTVVNESGQPVKNAWAYPYSDSNVYTGLSGRTDKQGQVVFDIPEGNFTFRADYKGSSYWSEIISNPPTASTTVTVK